MKNLCNRNTWRQFLLPAWMHTVAELRDFRGLRNVRRGRKDNIQEEPDHGKKLIIACKNKIFNQYQGQTFGKFDVVPLASGGWHHRKSKGDYFEINLGGKVPTLAENAHRSFESLPILNDIIQILERNGFQHPTHIQEEGMNHILKGRNTLLAAETGSGKTLAYLLPLLTQIFSWKTDIQREKMNSPLGIVITPSRELAEQIGENAKLFSDALGINVEILTGGHTKRMILSPSFKEVDLVVATIGVLSKLITTGVYRTSHVRHVVLDEADSLLDDSFNGKLLYILRRFRLLPPESEAISDENPCVQITMASATMPRSIADLLGEVIDLKTLYKVTTKNLHCIQAHVPQKFIRVSHALKPALLLQLAKADAGKGEPLLIFSNRSSTSDWISMFLNENDVKCINMNGDMPYKVRVGKFEKFQSGAVNVLSSTDMGSRGLDTVRVQHLINYEFPIYMVDYIHRCGRTGRIGSPQNCHITNMVGGHLEIDLVQKIELAVRKGEDLPNVNANIKRIIEHKLSKNLV